MHVRTRDEGPGRGLIRRAIDPAGLSFVEGGAFASGADGGGPPLATLLSLSSRGGGEALLVIGRHDAPVLVDGFPPLPLSLLADRSELVVDGRVLQLFAREAPAVTRFPEGAPAERCSACTREIRANDSILRCASCDFPAHEGPRADPALPPLLCASNDERCCRCGQLRGERGGDEPAGEASDDASDEGRGS